MTATKDPTKAESYDEQVEVRFWDGTKFVNPVKVDGFRTKGLAGELIFRTKSMVTAGHPAKGSEITAADGTVYLVVRATRNHGYTTSVVEPKPGP